MGEAELPSTQPDEVIGHEEKVVKQAVPGAPCDNITATRITAGTTCATPEATAAEKVTLRTVAAEGT